MDLFVWDRSFSTGLQAMDDQHRGLIDIFNELHRTQFDIAYPADKRELAMRRAFDRLMAYARAQFASEEALMQEQGLDERHQFVHRRQHEQFIRNLREMWNDRQTLPDLNGRMMGFLSSWIGLHVLGVDQAMVRQMRLIEAGQLPSEVYERESAVSDKGLRALLNMVGRLYHDLSTQTQGLADAERQMASLAQRLEVHARFDELLQVANRRYFDQRLSEEVARAFRGEQPLAVLVVGLDHFGGTVDPQALAVVDDCLRTVTQAVAGAMKRTTDFVARHSDHRLVVMMPETDRNGAAQAALRLVHTVSALQLPHPLFPAVGVTVSVGVAGWVPRSRDDAPLLLSEAEAAQVLARQQGGNRHAVA
ncbi:MAG TPA: diguanylate cyclase [Burkholderiaceae bacterium]|nr:diguanylate cyclase [Burkholderiaceae bacterium]